MNDSTLFAEEPTPSASSTHGIAPVPISVPDKNTVDKPNKLHATVALCVLVHGEAVRFNRGKTRGNDFDFKYMKGARGEIYPYVSAQCFKKYWRESLPTVPSPITREKNAKGEEKNQAFTSGNPFDYVDDDLFGYMIAGAEAAEEIAENGGDDDPLEGVDTVEAALEALLFTPDNIRDADKLLARFHDESKVATYLQEQMDSESSDVFRESPKGGIPSESVIAIMLAALNAAVRDENFSASAGISLSNPQKKKLAGGKADDIVTTNRDLLLKVFTKELKKEEKVKRPTTRRTAPVRMHALLAFSGIKTAQDFQTFSRDVALSGKNSILNPNPVGLYSGWLKTRVLIEASRIGKFYIGANMDVLAPEAEGHDKLEEENLYDPRKGKVTFAQLGSEVRQARLKHVLEALANVGNNQGPASGALHDGSLKPKAFIGAVMRCADSPFDPVWQGTSDQPQLDLIRMEAILEDWEDLFLEKTIYIGLPVETVNEEDNGQFKSDIVKRLEKLGFRAIVGSPRKTLLQFADYAAQLAVPIL